jgi:hypothetical protein
MYFGWKKGKKCLANPNTPICKNKLDKVKNKIIFIGHNLKHLSLNFASNQTQTIDDPKHVYYFNTNQMIGSKIKYFSLTLEHMMLIQEKKYL